MSDDTAKAASDDTANAASADRAASNNTMKAHSEGESDDTVKGPEGR